jgi:ATP synthase protein I
VPDREGNSGDLGREAGLQARRRLRARRAAGHVWPGLGLFGLIGWSVAVPTVTGALLGLWLDKRHSGEHSWTLTLLVAGLCIGCGNAWHWMAKEQDAIRRGQEDDQ